MLVKDIAQHLDDLEVGTLGTDIFVGELPFLNDSGAKVSAGLYVANVAGQGKEQYLNTIHEQLEFWALGMQYEAAYDKIEEVRNQLASKQNYELTDSYVYFSEEVTSIADMGRTADGMKMYKLTLNFIYYDKVVLS